VICPERPPTGALLNIEAAIAPREPRILATTAGDLPLEEYRLALGGRAWTILHTGAILSHEDEQRFLSGAQPRLPYGIALWPSAIALAHEIAARSLQGLRVLELGSGTGLPGIVAATLGARVVQTDRNRAALVVGRKNAARNAVVVEQRAADWTAWQDTDSYDYIVGSDILYAETVHAPLRRIFETNLAPGGRLLLADPFRPAGFELLEAMAADGWNVAINKWTVGVVPPPRPIGVFELTRDAPARTGPTPASAS
jgi:predicted nicotinamide N-methyase